MLRSNVPALLGLFALSACASDPDIVLIDEHPADSESVTDGELTFDENPLAGSITSPDGEVSPEVPPAFDSMYEAGELELPGVEDPEAEFQRLAGSSLTDAERLEL